MRKRTLDFVVVSLTLCLLIVTTAVVFLHEAGEQSSAARFVGVSAYAAEASRPSYVAATSKAPAGSSVSETASKTPESAIASASMGLPSDSEKIIESRVRATIPPILPLQPVAAAIPVQPAPSAYEPAMGEATVGEETESALPQQVEYVATEAPTAAPTDAPTEAATTPRPETVLTEPQELPKVTEAIQEPRLPSETAAPAASGLAFQTPGTQGATACNYGIIASLLQKNGARNYLNYSDNGNGTITVDGVTLLVAGAPFSWLTTCYDGHECAKVSNFEYGDVNTTAMGLIPARGMVAAAIGGFPFGTVLFVEGYGLCVVADRHGMGHDFLDLAMDPYEIENGVILPTQNRNIYVISIP